MTAPLRIAILTHSTNPRGGVVHALAIADALTDLGHEAVVHAPDPSGHGFFRATLCGTVSVPAGSVKGLDTPAMVERRIADYTAFFADPAHRGYDIYHAHDGIGANALADLQVAGLVPGFARTVHHLDTFADAGLAARQSRGVRAARAVFCVSDLWQGLLRRDLGIEAHRIDNGVDRAMFSPVVRAIDDEVRGRWGLRQNPIFLSVGGLEARKNSLGVIEAFSSVRTQVPSAQLVIVGGASVLDHAAYDRRCVEALARHGLTLGRGCDVIRTGPVPQADMPAFYRLADTLVFPSLHEGFGLAVIEAMASLTPVVVSAIAPFTDYLTARDALWCDPAAPETIGAAMRLSLDSALREDLVRHGAAVAARFEWSASARRHLAVYDTMVRCGEDAFA